MHTGLHRPTTSDAEAAGWPSRISGDDALPTQGAGFRVASGLYTVVVSLALFALVTITLLSLCATTLPDPLPENPISEDFAILTLLSPSSVPKLLPSLAWLVVLLAAFAIFARFVRPSRRGLLSVCAVALFVALFMQAILIVAAMTKDYLWGDAYYLFTHVQADVAQYPDDPLKYLAQSVAATRREELTSHGQTLASYLMCYPFQSGMYLVYRTAFRIFGSAAHPVIQFCNAIANVGSAGCIVYLAGLLVPENEQVRARFLSTLLMLLCMPLWMLCLYSYGNQIGMLFALLYLIGHIRSKEPTMLAKRLMWHAFSFVMLSVALMFKSTFILFAIGAWIATLIVSLSEGRRALTHLLLASLVIVGAHTAGQMPQRYLAHETGLDISRPLTSFNHLVVGFAEDEESWITVSYDGGERVPARGWYTPVATFIWADVRGDAHAQNVAARRLLVEELQELGGPVGLVRFLLGKTTSEWCAPDYQGFYFMAPCRDGEGGLANPLSSSESHRAFALRLLEAMDGYQSAIYLLALSSFVLSTLRRRKARRQQEGAVDQLQGVPNPRYAFLVAICTFFTGAGCYLLWEAKGVYVFPFFVLLIPVATQGLLELVGTSRQSAISENAARPANDVHSRED